MVSEEDDEIKHSQTICATLCIITTATSANVKEANGGESKRRPFNGKSKYLCVLVPVATLDLSAVIYRSSVSVYHFLASFF